MRGRRDIIAACGLYNSGSLKQGGPYSNATTGSGTANTPRAIDAVWSVSISSDGKRLATASGIRQNRTESGIVKIWDLPTGQELMSFNDFGGCTYSVDFSRDGRLLAVGSIAGAKIIGDLR